MPKMSDWFADIQYVTTLHAQDVTLVSNNTRTSGLPRAQGARLTRQLQHVTALHAQDVTLVSNAGPTTICQGKFEYQRFNKSRRPGRGRNIF